ncbi:hypothetical protein F4778DRAFT_728797 [Xylariomycetidae sp. FL2044]|nr:hypothetical protein F4778DRAFT_728797 [Xylariomycetidae sp. FL2044]
MEEILVDRFQSLGLGGHQPAQVPFNPPDDHPFEHADVPRYLFRVFSSHSSGQNDSEWIKSEDAENGALRDIFSPSFSPSEVALTLYKHLRRWKTTYADPFISWTSSLLFAIQYAIYMCRAKHYELASIQLCIVDTSLFPLRTFMRDLELISYFKRYNRILTNIENLRKTERKGYRGTYYFGEYLSQGQIEIQHRSAVVSCDKIINGDLFHVMPGFRFNTQSGKPQWANAVVELREPFYDARQEIVEDEEFQAAKRIASQFTPKWTLAMLINLLALRPRSNQAAILIHDHLVACPEEYQYPHDVAFIADRKTPEGVQVCQMISTVNALANFVESIDTLAAALRPSKNPLNAHSIEAQQFPQSRNVGLLFNAVRKNSRLSLEDRLIRLEFIELFCQVAQVWKPCLRDGLE